MLEQFAISQLIRHSRVQFALGSSGKLRQHAPALHRSESMRRETDRTGVRIEQGKGERRFGGNAGRDLYLRFALTLSKESGASYFAQAYIPTQPAQAIEDTRISRAHEDPGRQESYFPPARQGAKAGLGETRFPRIVQWRGYDCRARPAVVPDILRRAPVALVTWK
jgi:hypothetical protein